VQGDEPQIAPGQVEHVIRLLKMDSEADMGTLAHPIEEETTWKDPNAVKVVTDRSGNALYFSRSPIPYVRDSADWIADSPARPMRHLGIYSFRRDFLLTYSDMPPAPLEQAEKLEQLRALSTGYRIKVGTTDRACMGIDTPEDLQRWLDLYR
jgi:3-deoxy-manno-octulosonate cytidylyltransferase (CMP-KDO synthetase)